MPWSSETFHGGKKEAHERRVKTVPAGLKPKDLVGILWRVAFALQDDGWWLLRDNVWSKPNPMPESTTDRCTSAHEYVFQLTKSARYYFDHEAIKEPAVPQQRTGKLGGPLADLSKLVGEVAAVERVPISFNVEEGKGRLRIGTAAEATMSPYIGPSGKVTTLNESVFSTIPGSPAYVSKASEYRRQSSKYGLRDVNLQGRNAIQGTFRFVA